MKKWGKDMVGAYADSTRGIYMGEKIQEIAEDEGWTGERLDTDDEFYNEATDEAEEWLNDNVAKEGYFFGTSEQGDWGYWAMDEEF